MAEPEQRADQLAANIAVAAVTRSRPVPSRRAALPPRFLRTSP
ncbi:MAG: hypothetical protein ACRDUW_10125 [Pseudonocardiaceae bacterium]